MTATTVTGLQTINHSGHTELREMTFTAVPVRSAGQVILVIKSGTRSAKYSLTLDAWDTLLAGTFTAPPEPEQESSAPF